MDTTIVLRAAIGVMTGAITVLAALIIQKLQSGSAKAMVSFQLHPEKTVREFRALFYGSCVMTAGFVVRLVGGFTGSSLLLDLARIGSLAFVVAAAYALYHWWRRF